MLVLSLCAFAQTQSHGAGWDGHTKEAIRRHTLGNKGNGEHATGHDGGYGTNHNSPEQQKKLSYEVYSKHTFHDAEKSPDQNALCCHLRMTYSTTEGPIYEKKSRITVPASHNRDYCAGRRTRHCDVIHELYSSKLVLAS